MVLQVPPARKFSQKGFSGCIDELKKFLQFIGRVGRGRAPVFKEFVTIAPTFLPDDIILWLYVLSA